MFHALLLIDIQNDYFGNGANELVHMDDAATKATSLLTLFRNKSLPIYHVQHLAIQEGATFFLPGTKGAKIHHSVRPKDAGPVIIKHFPNSFRETNLHQLCFQDGVTTLVICGAMSRMCVDGTMRAAFDFGFHCIVSDGACATKDLEFNGGTIGSHEVHEAFMTALSSGYAQVYTLNEFMEEVA